MYFKITSTMARNSILICACMVLASCGGKISQSSYDTNKKEEGGSVMGKSEKHAAVRNKEKMLNDCIVLKELKLPDGRKIQAGNFFFLRNMQRFYTTFKIERKIKDEYFGPFGYRMGQITEQGVTSLKKNDYYVKPDVGLQYNNISSQEQTVISRILGVSTPYFSNDKNYGYTDRPTADDSKWLFFLEKNYLLSFTQGTSRGISDTELITDGRNATSILDGAIASCLK